MTVEDSCIWLKPSGQQTGCLPENPVQRGGATGGPSIEAVGALENPELMPTPLYSVARNSCMGRVVASALDTAAGFLEASRHWSRGHRFGVFTPPTSGPSPVTLKFTRESLCSLILG